jgi:hypothetical protein
MATAIAKALKIGIRIIRHVSLDISAKHFNATDGRDELLPFSRHSCATGCRPVRARL